MITFWTILLLLSPQSGFISQTAGPEQIKFYYKEKGQEIKYLENIRNVDPNVVFAMNIQMFAIGNHWKSYTPVGLYIDNGRLVQKIWKINNPRVNFGMQPQCIFAITKDGKAVMQPLTQAVITNYKYAVELAPMLVINGKINPQLTKSQNRYVRNGVGILKDGRVLFAISKEPVSFGELANYFITHGCVSASYIDGVVSDFWRPGEVRQHPDRFAVMVGVSKY